MGEGNPYSGPCSVGKEAVIYFSIPENREGRCGRKDKGRERALLKSNYRCVNSLFSRKPTRAI